MSGPIVTRFREELTEWIEGHLTQNVQARYAKAREQFMAWCQIVGLEPADLQAEEIDVMVAKFVLHVKEDCDDLLTRQGCSDLLATMQRRAGIKLHVTRQVLRLWSREFPPKQAEAMPAMVAYAAVTVMRHVLEQPAAAFHTLVAFSGLLRIGESLQLRREDIVVPRASGPQHVVLVLRTTKRGFDQRVVLSHPGVVAAVVGFLKAHPGEDYELAAPLSYERFARCLKKVVKLLRLPGDSWRSHSLRRGGATALMEHGWSFDNVRQYGRWSSESSAREYVRLGQVALSRLNRCLGEERWHMFRVLAGGCVEALMA